MQKIVVDANILVAAAIRDGMTRKILFESNFIVLVPEHIFYELEKYREYICKKTDGAEESFDVFIIRVFGRVKPVSFIEFYDCISYARKICPDKDDALYFALALKFNCPLWSNETRLKNQKFIKVYSTQELLGMLK